MDSEDSCSDCDESESVIRRRTFEHFMENKEKIKKRNNDEVVNFYKNMINNLRTKHRVKHTKKKEPNGRSRYDSYGSDVSYNMRYYHVVENQGNVVRGLEEVAKRGQTIEEVASEYVKKNTPNLSWDPDGTIRDVMYRIYHTPDHLKKERFTLLQKAMFDALVTNENGKNVEKENGSQSANNLPRSHGKKIKQKSSKGSMNSFSLGSDSISDPKSIENKRSKINLIEDYEDVCPSSLSGSSIECKDKFKVIEAIKSSIDIVKSFTEENN